MEYEEKKLEELSNNITNHFWKDVILAWKEYKDDADDLSGFLCDDILNYIPVNSFKQFIPYERNGVKVIKDLLDNNYQFLAFNEVKTKCENLNFLQYFALIGKIPKDKINMLRHQQVINIPVKNTNFIRKLLQIKDLRCVYKSLVEKYKQYPVERQEKWNRKLNINLNDDIGWEKIYSTSFVVTKDTKLQNIQFKILHRILTTNSFLYQINVIDENVCTFCRDIPETLEHLFFDCVKVNPIWKAFKVWCNNVNNNNFRIIDDMNIKDVLFYCEKGPPIINYLILIIKYYIYTCRFKNTQPSFIGGKTQIIKQQQIEKNVAMLNNTMNNFNQKWSPLNI